MIYVTGKTLDVRAFRAALNHAGSTRGTAHGGPDFVPTELDADGLAPGWSSPCVAEPIEVGEDAVLEVPDDCAHLFDGLEGRPPLAARLLFEELPTAVRARMEELSAERQASAAELGEGG